jgi:hypothetical protein
MSFHTWLNVGVLFTTYIFIGAFIFGVVSNYFVHHGWNNIIIGLGVTYGQRALIQTHLLGGIYAMLMYPIQTFLPRKIYIHIATGVTICLAMMSSAVSDIIYIFMYGTIGGTIMSICFGIDGFITFGLGGGIIIINLLYRKAIQTVISAPVTEQDDIGSVNSVSSSVSSEEPPSSDLDNITPLLNLAESTRVVDKYKKLHKILISLFGGMVYASLLYRILYLYAYLFGYDIPTIYEMYNRPLDIIYQFAFFALPLIIMMIYARVKRTRIPMKIILVTFNVINLLLFVII